MELDVARSARSASEGESDFVLGVYPRAYLGGVVMARALEGQSRRAEVLDMARSIDSTQRAEIAAMTKMLEQRSAQPLPSIL
jgi:uncharacterized protein (DUF305 family)